MSSTRERLRSDRAVSRSLNDRPFEHDDEVNFPKKYQKFNILQFSGAISVARSNEKKLTDYLKKANSVDDENSANARSIKSSLHKKHNSKSFKDFLSKFADFGLN